MSVSITSPEIIAENGYSDDPIVHSIFYRLVKLQTKIGVLPESTEHLALFCKVEHSVFLEKWKQVKSILPRIEVNPIRKEDIEKGSTRYKYLVKIAAANFGGLISQSGLSKREINELKRRFDPSIIVDNALLRDSTRDSVKAEGKEWFLAAKEEVAEAIHKRRLYEKKRAIEKAKKIVEDSAAKAKVVESDKQEDKECEAFLEQIVEIDGDKLPVKKHIAVSQTKALREAYPFIDEKLGFEKKICLVTWLRYKRTRKPLWKETQIKSFARRVEDYDISVVRKALKISIDNRYQGFLYAKLDDFQREAEKKKPYAKHNDPASKRMMDIKLVDKVEAKYMEYYKAIVEDYPTLSMSKWNLLSRKEYLYFESAMFTKQIFPRYYSKIPEYIQKAYHEANVNRYHATRFNNSFFEFLCHFIHMEEYKGDKTFNSYRSGEYKENIKRVDSIIHNYKLRNNIEYFKTHYPTLLNKVKAECKSGGFDFEKAKQDLLNSYGVVDTNGVLSFKLKKT